jgi:hypothetical protein
MRSLTRVFRTSPTVFSGLAPVPLALEPVLVSLPSRTGDGTGARHCGGFDAPPPAAAARGGP